MLLGYVIVEKFYNVVSAMHFYRKQISMLENERKKSDYQPIREITIERHKYTENWDETYEQEKEKIIESQKVLVEGRLSQESL